MMLARTAILLAWLSVLATAPRVIPDAAVLLGPIDETAPAAPAGLVHIETVGTDVELIGSQDDVVRITGEIGEGAEIELERTDDSTRIRVAATKDGPDGADRLIVQVPKRSEVRVKSRTGLLRMSGVEGAAVLETATGSVTVDGRPATLDVTTLAGDMYLVTASPRISANSVAGRVHVSGARGKLEASTISGWIQIDDAELAASEISTLSGRATVAATLRPDGPHLIKSHSGRIVLHVPADQPVEIEANSHLGTLRNKFEGLTGRAPVRVSIGKRGPNVRVRSFDGGITIAPN